MLTKLRQMIPTELYYWLTLIRSWSIRILTQRKTNQPFGHWLNLHYQKSLEFPPKIIVLIWVITRGSFISISMFYMWCVLFISQPLYEFRRHDGQHLLMYVITTGHVVTCKQNHSFFILPSKKSRQNVRVCNVFSRQTQRRDTQRSVRSSFLSCL